MNSQKEFDQIDKSKIYGPFLPDDWKVDPQSSEEIKIKIHNFYNNAADVTGHGRVPLIAIDHDASNDNAKKRARLKLRIAALAIMIVALGAIILINSAKIVTAAILHTDDKVLSAAMDTSPDMVAAALNQMNVGGE